VLVEAPINIFHIAYLDVVSNDLRKRQQRYKKVLVDCQNKLPLYDIRSLQPDS